MTDVTKRYGRAGVLALDALSFEIPTGRITGFIGHNGAGKTTAFSIVAGFLPPDSGAVDILGLGPFDARKLKGKLGVLPQDAALPDRHTPVELFRHLCRLQGMGAAAALREADRVLEAVRLGDRRRSRIHTLSHGMRRRVAVASALCGSPALVLLDEPLAGLDPVQAHALRDTIANLRGTQTVVISSHNLGELERISDRVVMLSAGRCIRQGTLSEVTGQAEVVHWTLAHADAPLDALRARLPDHTFTLEGVRLTQRAGSEVDLDAASVAVMAVLAEAGVAVRALSRGVGLERRFIRDSEAATAPR